MKVAIVFLVCLTYVWAKPAPQLPISFENGTFKVNFGGYHAEAGLGGLLTGNAAHGGLHASAGTPFGQSAAAGLGGALNGEKGTAGGLYAGATAGGNVAARAGIGGALHPSGTAVGVKHAQAQAGAAVSGVHTKTHGVVGGDTITKTVITDSVPQPARKVFIEDVNAIPVTQVVYKTRVKSRRPHHHRKIVLINGDYVPAHQRVSYPVYSSGGYGGGFFDSGFGASAGLGGGLGAGAGFGGGGYGAGAGIGGLGASAGLGGYKSGGLGASAGIGGLGASAGIGGLGASAGIGGLGASAGIGGLGASAGLGGLSADAGLGGKFEASAGGYGEGDGETYGRSVSDAFFDDIYHDPTLSAVNKLAISSSGGSKKGTVF